MNTIILFVGGGGGGFAEQNFFFMIFIFLTKNLGWRKKAGSFCLTTNIHVENIRPVVDTWGMS